MGRLRLASSVVAVALVLPASAEAYFGTHDRRSERPINVSVATLMPTWSSSRLVSLRPVAPAGHLRLVLEGPHGEYREVVLRRLASRPSVSRVTIRLASLGTWRLSVLGWEFAPRTCAPPALVRVATA